MARLDHWEVESWNQKYPVGTDVRLKVSSGHIVNTKTRTEAFLTRAGHAACFFNGISGYYFLDRATPLEEK